MKIIKQKINVLMFVLVCFVCLLAVFFVGNSRLANAQEHEMQEINSSADYDLSIREFILSIEDELNEKGTGTIEVLQSQKDYLSDLVDESLPSEKTVIFAKISILNEAINTINEVGYFTQSIGVRSIGNNNIYANYPFRVSPNCTCSASNYIIQTPCWNCVRYTDLNTEVMTIQSLFKTRGWHLAADLLLHNRVNTEIDSEYWPSTALSDRIAGAWQIANNLAYNNKIASGFNQVSPGELNGLLVKEIDGDAYNSLGKFNFKKTFVDDGIVEVDIIDRYDWDISDIESSASFLNNNMVAAQEMGILTPFYTRIKLTMPGSVPFKWRYIDSGVEITGLVPGVMVNGDYGEEIYDLTVYPQAGVAPSVLNITSVCDGVFENSTSLTSFNMFKNIINVGACAFKGCKNLPSTIDLNAVEVIGEEAFSGCSNLRVLNYTSKLKVIGKRAFYNCSDFNTLYSFENVESIGDEAFYNCNLYSLNSGSKIKTIGARAFYNNRGLSVNAYLSSLQSIGEEAFMGCSWIESLESLSNLKTLGARAFKGCEKLATVEYLSGLEEIGEEAFYGCTKLTKILYARTLKSIGKKAFYNCNALTELDGTIALENIGEEAFFGCGQLRKIHTLNRLKTIDAGAFKGCVSFAETSLPAIERIEDEAFIGCTGLLNLTLGEDAKHIGARAFSGCNNLSRISWEGQLSNIGEEAFSECTSLVVDNLPAASIGARAFMNCTSITALAFPDAVSIGQEAFKGCTGLTSLCFARGNTPVSASIGARAFENCTNINEVVCDSFNVPTLGENCFPNNCGFTLLVPYNKSGEYTNIFAAYTSSVGYTTVRITLVCGGTESTKDVYYGQALGLSSFRKDGYLFRGWFGTADYKGQKRSLNEICTTKENFTLYGRLVSRSDIENYIAKLGTLADYYVQNGYESINSNTFSISDIAEYYRQMGSIYAGGELYKNIEVQEILTNVSHPYNIVVGNVGTSVREELEFIREHLGVCENIYVTGLSIGTFLNSLGYELNNYADDALLDMAREIYNMAEARGSHIIFPTMFYAVSADYRTTAGLKSLDDIGANEAALFGIFPEMSTTGTLAVYGYSGFFTVEEYSVMSDEVKAEYENAARAFVTEIENSKYNNVNKLFFGDTLRLCNENKYSFVSEKGRAPSLQNAIFQHLMVGGETINNITEIFRANPRAGERMLMRVECNIGYTDNRMDMDKFSKAISKCLPDIRWALESGCKVILMASNKVDKDDASDWQAKEFGNGRFLSEFSQAVGVEARFVSVDNIYDVLNDNCSVYWISNLYPYEKYYAFPSA